MSNRPALTRRGFILLTGVAALAACTPVDYQGLQDSALARVRQALAERFASQFGITIDSVLGTLSGEGGFLRNPLVKILLPPPLGLALSVGQAMADNPQEALLEVLVNRAAEEAIPVVGPVIKETLQSLIMDGKLATLLSGEPGAVTEAIKAESADRLKAALVPAIGKSLEKSGAGELYTTLMAVRAQADQVQDAIDEADDLATMDEPSDLDALFGLADGSGETEAVEAVEEEEPTDLSALLVDTATRGERASAETAIAANPEDLQNYIADKAVDGVFKLLAGKEQSIRANLEAPAAF